jgi:hypothetical protein
VGTPAPPRAVTVTKYEVVIQGKAQRFDTLLEARRYRNDNGGTLRTVAAASPA